jgi:uncharacterized protein YbjT (DUF2867 family)
VRILLLGAGGFIGRHILAELIAHGHEVVGVARDASTLAAAFPGARFVAIDLARATAESDWSPHLAGVDAIVNAAGVLRGRDMDAVHVAMPRALHVAAARAGVRRSVLISAISARANVISDYAQSKLAGEAVVRESGLAWTILRPSLVYGRGSYGGTSLLRGLAGLPWLIPVPGNGDYLFTPIDVDDLARTVRIVCEQERFAGARLEPVGPETIDLKSLLARYRAWLGFGRARFMRVPMSLMRLLARIGDLVGSGPVGANSLVQMIAGNDGDSAAFAEAIGFAPRSLDRALRDRPGEVQDRWHARLYFVAPAVTATLVIIWIASALLGVFAGAGETQALVRALGFAPAFANPLRLASSGLDLFVAALVIFDSKARASTFVQVIVVLGYTLVIGAALPRLWLDPLGPLLKNLPVLTLALVHGAIGGRR